MTPKTGTTAIPTNSTSAIYRRIVDPAEAARTLIVPEGFFVLEDGNAYRTMGRFTGRFVTRWGGRCPTIERFNIDTEVVDGAIWGVVGAKINGTLFMPAASVVA